MKQLAAPFHACTPKQENPVSGRLEKAPTVLHFSCNPSHLLLHRSILTSNGFCVLDESNGFEATTVRLEVEQNQLVAGIG